MLRIVLQQAYLPLWGWRIPWATFLVISAGSLTSPRFPCDPAEGAACFHDDEVDLVFFADCLEVVSVGGSVKKLVLSNF